MVATTSNGKPREGRFTGTCRAAASAVHSRRLGRRRIQPPEVLEHQPTLLGGEALELLPPGISESRARARRARFQDRSEEHTSELQSLAYLVCRLLLEKKKQTIVIPASPC